MELSHTDIRPVLTEEELADAKQHIRSIDDFGGMLKLALSGFDGVLADIEKGSKTKTFNILVASELDATIGCVGLTSLSAECCELRGLYVVAPARHQGVGRALVMRAIQWATTQECQAVFLELQKSQMKYAMRLYESVGFKPCAPFKKEPLADSISLELRLADTQGALESTRGPQLPH